MRVGREALRLAHGTNERIAVAGLSTSVAYFMQLIRASDALPRSGPPLAELTPRQHPGRTCGVSAAAVEAHGLSRRYGRRWALIDVSLRVERGTVAMLTGRNGSGKSTLLRVLATALRPDRGSARVAGHDIRSETAAVRRRVALLAHDSHLYEALTALDNLRIAARFLGLDPGRAALLPRLAEVGLDERADDAVVTFSAGMRKRLALAHTLLQPAEVVLLDEPYGQLDPPGFRMVDGVLERLRGAGATVLLATHLLERGSALCDQAVVLESGRLTWSGPAAELPSGAGPAAGG